MLILPLDGKNPVKLISHWKASFYGFDLIAEYFTEHRTDILQKRASIPSVMGYQADVYANIGETKGHGVDLDLKYQKNLNKTLF